MISGSMDHLQDLMTIQVFRSIQRRGHDIRNHSNHIWSNHSVFGNSRP
jgi:hypothetical protein